MRRNQHYHNRVNRVLDYIEEHLDGELSLTRLAAIGCFSPEILGDDTENNMEENAARLLSQVRSIAAATYKMGAGQPMMYPRPDFKYAENFLHMMFSKPYQEYVPTPEVASALPPAGMPEPQAEVLAETFAEAQTTGRVKALGHTTLDLGTKLNVVIQTQGKQGETLAAMLHNHRQPAGGPIVCSGQMKQAAQTNHRERLAA